MRYAVSHESLIALRSRELPVSNKATWDLMSRIEERVHSFVVRIWAEDTINEAEEVTWRGHVTHIPSNTRRYFERIDTLSQFIAGYLHLSDE